MAVAAWFLAILAAAGCGGGNPSSPSPGSVPALSVTPGSLSFTAQAGGGNPVSRSISVSNSAGGALSWAASDNATWLSVTPANGDAPSTLTVSVDIAGLSAGTYDGAVTIVSSGAAGSPGIIPVTLAVVPTVWPQVSLETVATGFAQPVHVTHSGDGSGRLFVVEQAGRIRILDNGVVLPIPFLDIASRVASAGEQGLLSVAFPPGYPDKRYFYVYYTPVPGDNTVVARYRVTADNNIADSTSETIVLRVPQPFGNHNGGQIAFGPDGYLYIGKGDGGGGGDPLNSGQRTDTLLGKILRIDVESGAATYAIPPDNPFVGIAGILPEIWALGLRNPWRFSFDRGTGDLYLGDVGQGTFEEIDYQPFGDNVGRNYGWKIMEGGSCYPPGTIGCDQSGLALPVFVYDHSLGCSVTGGHVYRGSAFPSLQGVYLFGDYCSGRIWGLRRNGAVWDNALLLAPALNISTFGEDEEGNVYVANHTNGEILKIVVP
ncbi:MAG TPA: PQQ-dependent sugar dehydrogenase [Candidatus Deferrimicrobiaceae bacterium]